MPLGLNMQWLLVLNHLMHVIRTTSKKRAYSHWVLPEMHCYQHGMVAEVFEKKGTIILLLSMLDSVIQKKMKKKKKQCYCCVGFHKQGI